MKFEERFNIRLAQRVQDDGEMFAALPEDYKFIHAGVRLTPDEIGAAIREIETYMIDGSAISSRGTLKTAKAVVKQLAYERRNRTRC